MILKTECNRNCAEKLVWLDRHTLCKFERIPNIRNEQSGAS
jgi:hypothetical protein